MFVVRLDCMMRLNRKIRRLKAATAWYYICMIQYANQHVTNGYVPKEELANLWRSPCDTKFRFKSHVELLLKEGLLE